ncbi:uncharacterized protein V1518DRAFT_415339 [Limtongia smithiae]|uniref:uncharacterized protein n=1 Tax=Limtongia smithiae TaxID=1125753 RepID=UPI0034CDDF65
MITSMNAVGFDSSITFTIPMHQGRAQKPHSLSIFPHDELLSTSSSSSSSSSASSSEFSTPMSSPSYAYLPSRDGLVFAEVPGRLGGAMISLLGMPDMTAIRSRAPRKQSESRIPLPDLHARMGLAHDPDEARAREQHILGILKSQGFPLGERTWIRDTEEKERRVMIEEIYKLTHSLYGYDRPLLEVIVRRGAYHYMQGRLRRIRRSKKQQQKSRAGSATGLLSTPKSQDARTHNEDAISSSADSDRDRQSSVAEDDDEDDREKDEEEEETED